MERIPRLAFFFTKKSEQANKKLRPYSEQLSTVPQIKGDAEDLASDIAAEQDGDGSVHEPDGTAPAEKSQ